MGLASGRLSGPSGDSLLLAFVRVFTLGTGILSTAILSHNLSLNAYGTYSQGNLIVSLSADATILGLADAANYFFNGSIEKARSKAYVETVFAIQLVVGLVTGIGILLFQRQIIGYFENPLLSPIFVYVAFRPMLTNMASIFQVLIVSIGKAKVLAARNAVFSSLKLLAVLFTAIVSSNIVVLFIVLFALDVVTFVWFWELFRRDKFAVGLGRPHLGLVGEILSFSIPMALFVLTTSLTRQVGALVIGASESTEKYAIYANCASILPLDVVSAAFLTVLVPRVTRFVGLGDRGKALSVFKSYIAVGYLTTVTFSAACLVVSSEMVRLLYGESYLPGLAVFRLFLISGMVRFANLSLILSASGKTRTLMTVSLVSMAANVVGSIAGYELFGFEGPAISTVGINVVVMLALMSLSLRELGGSWSSVFDVGRVVMFLTTVTLVVVAGAIAKRVLLGLGLSWILSAGVVALLVVVSLLGLNWRAFKGALTSLNDIG